MMGAKVTVLQRTLTDYRIAFFDALCGQLEALDVALSVHAGQARRCEGLFEPVHERPYLERVHNCYVWRGVYWQSRALSAARSSDLIIFEQASSALHTYLLMLRRARKSPAKAAFWGHGCDFSKSSPGCLSERWKRLWLPHVDFWFPYTQRSADVLLQSGVSPEEFAVVNNAADTKALQQAVRLVSEEAKKEVHAKLWGEVRRDEHRVGVFCSRLLPSKALDLLLESCSLIHDRYPDFRLLVIGDGPLRRDVEAFAAEAPWFAVSEPLYGVSRAPLLSLADLWINPGTTGLAILDAFAVGVPYVTTRRHDHGPELAYLAESNGVLAAPDSHSVAHAVLDLMQDSKRLADLRVGARAAAERYTVEAMAERFVGGIIRCLSDSETC